MHPTINFVAYNKNWIDNLYTLWLQIASRTWNTSFLVQSVHWLPISSFNSNSNNNYIKKMQNMKQQIRGIFFHSIFWVVSNVVWFFRNLAWHFSSLDYQKAASPLCCRITAHYRQDYADNARMFACLQCLSSQPLTETNSHFSLAENRTLTMFIRNSLQVLMVYIKNVKMYIIRNKREENT